MKINLLVSWGSETLLPYRVENMLVKQRLAGWRRDLWEENVVYQQQPFVPIDIGHIRNRNIGFTKKEADCDDWIFMLIMTG